VKDLDAETVGPVGDIRTVVSTLSGTDGDVNGASRCVADDITGSASGLSGVRGVSSTGEAMSSLGSRCSTVISYLAGVLPLCFPANRNLGPIL
jgi:hypothetical protein